MVINSKDLRVYKELSELYQKVADCPKCGAPIYQYSGSWGGILPPPVKKNCNCVPANNGSLFTGYKIDLSQVSTKELHEELAKREGVREVIIDFADDEQIFVSGPARVLINID